jgi:serine/threonine-protein kinase
VGRAAAPVSAATFGLPVPIDPGDHTVTASAPHFKPWSTTVSVAKSANTNVQIPALEPAPEAAPAPVPVPPPAPAPAPQPQAAPPPPQTVVIYQSEPQKRGGAQRFWGVFSIVTGGVAMGLGVAGGFVAKGTWNKSNDPNQGPNGTPDCVNDVCTQNGLNHRRDAQNIANISQWVFVGGAIVAAGGIVLLVTAPSGYEQPQRAALTLSPTLGGAMLRGTW